MAKKVEITKKEYDLLRAIARQALYVWNVQFHNPTVYHKSEYGAQTRNNLTEKARQYKEMFDQDFELADAEIIFDPEEHVRFK